MAENEQQEARPMSALHRRALEQHQWDMQHQQYQWTPEELHAKPDPAGRGQQLKQPENSNGFSPENVPRSSQTGGTQNASSSSNFYSDLSTVNKASAKNWTQEEKDNFISIITTQLPYLLHQLTAPEMPKTAADERFITFMKFLEEQNVTDSLQGVAETAVSKLLESTQKVKMPLKEDLDPNIRKTSPSTPRRKRLSPITDTTDSATVSRSLSDSSETTMNDSWSFSSDLSADDRPRPKSNLTSIVDSQQFTSPNELKLLSDDFAELINYLEGGKGPNSSQGTSAAANMALEAMGKEMRGGVTRTIKTRSFSHYHSDTEVLNTGSFLTDMFPSVSGCEHHGSHFYSAKSILGREMTRSSFSESEYLSPRMSNEHLSRLAKSSEPLSSRARILASQAAGHVLPPKEATGDSHEISFAVSETSNVLSSTEQETLSSNSTMRLSDLPLEASSGPSGDTDRIVTSSQKTSLDMILSSSDERYGAFLDFLEQMKIFVALQDVVDEAVHKLIKPVKEEESSSLNTSTESASFQGDKAEGAVIVSKTKCHSFGMSDSSKYIPTESCSSSFTLEPELQTDSDIKKEFSSFHASSSEPQILTSASSATRKEKLENQSNLPSSLSLEGQGSFDDMFLGIVGQRMEKLTYEPSPPSQSQTPGSSLNISQSNATTNTSFGSDSSPRTKFTSSRSDHVVIPKSKSKSSSLSHVTPPKSKQRAPSLTLVTPAKPKSTSPHSIQVALAKSVGKTQKLKHASPKTSKLSSERKDSSHPSKELTSEELEYYSSWLSSSQKFESEMNWCPTTSSSAFSALQCFRPEEILDCILENIVHLMVYKYKTEKSLEGKIGVMTKPLSDPYLEKLFYSRNLHGRDRSHVLVQPLSLHEENCLASHPLWASSKTNKRFHLPWKSSSLSMAKRAELYSSSALSSQRDSFPSALPEIETLPTLSATISAHSGTTAEQGLQLGPSSRKHYKMVLPKI